MAGIAVNSNGWQVQGRSRGATTATGALPPGLPEDFLPTASTVEEVVLQPRATIRAAGAAASPIDLSCELAPGEAAVLVIRRPSGALTFHVPNETVRRTRGGPGAVRFSV